MPATWSAGAVGTRFATKYFMGRGGSMEKQQISTRVTWLSLAIGAACLGCGREPPTPATHGITSTPSAHEAATGAGPSRADDGLSPEMVEQREQLIVTLRRAGISDERVDRKR